MSAKRSKERKLYAAAMRWGRATLKRKDRGKRPGVSTTYELDDRQRLRIGRDSTRRIVNVTLFDGVVPVGMLLVGEDWGVDRREAFEKLIEGVVDGYLTIRWSADIENFEFDLTDVGRRWLGHRNGQHGPPSPDPGEGWR